MRQKQAIIWSSLEAAIVTGGRNSREWAATGVALSIDDIKPGDLFFASKEDDLDIVFKKGAAAIVQAQCAEIHDKIPTLSVPSVFEALQALARAARFKSHAHILAVQGRQERESIAGLLSCSGDVHQSGRHLSLGLAGLPHEVDYGVFSLSPAVQPDIAVISNPQSAHRDTLFENMPTHGCVIVDADRDDYLSIISRAKAAGIKQIYTYGASTRCDVHIMQQITAGNGLRLSVSVLGEVHTLFMPHDFKLESAFLAALLVLKITGKSVVAAMKKLSRSADKPRLKLPENGVTLVGADLGAVQAVFRITNMIDLGFGRQTAILDDISKAAPEAMGLPRNNITIPRKLANLDFVYTSKRLSAVSNARTAIKQSQGYRKIETITPDVVAPGDFLVFKDVWNKSSAVLSEALRTIPERRKRKI